MAVHMKTVGNIKGVKTFKDEDYLRFAKMAKFKDSTSKSKKLDFIELCVNPDNYTGTTQRYIEFQSVTLQLATKRGGRFEYSLTAETDRHGKANISSAAFVPNAINICTCYVADTEYNRKRLVEILAGDLKIDGKDVSFNEGDIQIVDEDLAQKQFLSDAKKLYELKKKEREDLDLEAYTIAETVHIGVVEMLKKNYKIPDGSLVYREIKEYKESVLPRVKKELKRLKREKYNQLIKDRDNEE